MVGAAVAVVFGLAALGSIDQPADSATSPSEPLTALATPVPMPRRTAPPTEAPTPEPTFGPTGRTTQATVVRIIDGDTIEVDLDGVIEKVRYIGMDTPETVDPSSPVEWMGPEATKANEALVLGQTVLLETDVRDRDDFGRLLRYVWIPGATAWTLVNVELLRLGYASVATYPPDVKYADLFVTAERSARAASEGLWAATPPPPTPSPTLDPTPVSFFEPPPEPAADCHPSYDPCLPIVADLNCPDVRAMGADPVAVIGPDEYRLDGDGDGTGCD